MNILVIDGQGGGVGKALITQLKSVFPQCSIMAVGTNSIASSVMKKAGADIVATGENAVKVNSRRADVITGPVGIIAADSLYGEISAEMAVAVAQSEAVKVLIPFQNCGVTIAGCDAVPLAESIVSAVKKIAQIAENGEKSKKNLK